MNGIVIESIYGDYIIVMRTFIVRNNNQIYISGLKILKNTALKTKTYKDTIVIELLVFTLRSIASFCHVGL